MSWQVLSNYYSELNDEAKKQYSNKLKMMYDVDPYLRMEEIRERDCFYRVDKLA